MKTVFIVEYGYSSSLDGNSTLDSIWTSEEKAREHILKQLRPYHEQCKNKKGELLNSWGDGDYWISYSEVKVDTEFMYGEN